MMGFWKNKRGQKQTLGYKNHGTGRVLAFVDYIKVGSIVKLLYMHKM